MTALWLSRVRLRRDSGAVAALSALLVPENGDARIAASHRLVWALFATGTGQTRDFLWREEGPGRFLILSARPAGHGAGLFEVESKPFEPQLAVGDRLGFALRANPVISRGEPGSGRGKRHDVVMDALRHHPKGDWALHRLSLVAEAGQGWLHRQGKRQGFTLSDNLACDGYEQVAIARERGAQPARFSQVDFTGVLTVTEPARFTAALAQGFGHAKAFGCELMLIRRA